MRVVNTLLLRTSITSPRTVLLFVFDSYNSEPVSHRVRWRIDWLESSEELAAAVAARVHAPKRQHPWLVLLRPRPLKRPDGQTLPPGVRLTQHPKWFAGPYQPSEIFTFETGLDMACRYVWLMATRS